MYSNQIAQNHQSQILDLLKFSNEQILRAHKYAKIDFLAVLEAVKWAKLFANKLAKIDFT